MEKLRWWHYSGYGLGDMANGLTFGMTTAFLLPFYTDVLGIGAAAAGTLFLAARLWDGVNDPLMGILADRSFRRRRIRGKGGDKFRPFLLAGSGPAALSALVLFLVPGRLSPDHRLAWACASYIAWGMAYTFVNIPYGSLATVMTGDPVERALLSVSRGIGSLSGVILPRILFPLFLIRHAASQAKGFGNAALLLAPAAFALYLTSYLTTFEKTSDSTEGREIPAGTGGKPRLLRNRPFLGLSLASFFMLTGLSVNGAMNLYYFRENLDALNLMSFAAAAAVPAAGAALLVPRLVRRYGAARTSGGASLLSSLIWLILFLLPSRPWLYLAGALGAYLFLMVPHMTVWAMVSDCIDYQEALTGERREGTVYGSYSFVRKAGQAAAGFLSGAGLALTGYAPGLAEQSFRTLEGIKFMTLGIPGVCLFAAWLSYRFVWNIPAEETHA